MRAKSSALPTPLPPATMTEASSRLMTPAFSETTSITLAARPLAPNPTVRGTTSGSRTASSRANTFGRTVATAVLVVACFSTMMLPPKHGWVATKPPSRNSRPVMSTSSPAPRRAAQPEATSRPSGEPEQSTMAGSAA